MLVLLQEAEVVSLHRKLQQETKEAHDRLSLRSILLVSIAVQYRRIRVLRRKRRVSRDHCVFVMLPLEFEGGSVDVLRFILRYCLLLGL